MNSLAIPLSSIRRNTRHYLRLLLPLPALLALALVLQGCNGGDNENGSQNDNGSNGSSTDTDFEPDPAFGADGLPAFRLLTNNNGFDLTEGSLLTLPITIERANGHNSDVTLAIDDSTDSPDNLFSASLERTQLGGEDTQTTLTTIFNHGQQRTNEQQREVVVTATDSSSTSTARFILNIRPTSLADIYLLVGQSNMVGFSEDFAKMAGSGEPDETNPSIMQLNVTANDTVTFTTVEQFANPDAQIAFPDFVVAEDPLHISRAISLDEKPGTRIGLGLSFARRALRSDGTHQIILVPAAWSSTGFCNTGEFLSQAIDAPQFIADGELGWNAFEQTASEFGGTTLFTRAVLRANLAIQRSGGILRGILWHQGESDSENPVCAEQYASNLATLVSELRTRIIQDVRGPDARGASSDIPFIAGTMSKGNDERGNFSMFSDNKLMVDTAHRTLGIQGIVPHYGFANLDDLTPNGGFPCGEGSCVHYGSAAYREMGVRYFDQLTAVLNQP